MLFSWYVKLGHADTHVWVMFEAEVSGVKHVNLHMLISPNQLSGQIAIQ